MEISTELKEILDKGFLDREYHRFKSRAFLLDSTIGTQKSYSLITAINKYVKKHPYEELTIFSMTQSLPVVIPLTAVYKSSDLLTYDGTLVFTDIVSYPSTIQASRSKKYYYVYDILEMKMVSPQHIIHMAANVSAVVARNADHKRVLEKIFPANLIWPETYSDFNEFLEGFKPDGNSN